MKKLIVLLVFACVPLALTASEDAWISGNVLYDDENCGEPVAYVDEQGNILAEFPYIDEQGNISMEFPLPRDAIVGLHKP